MVIVYSKLLQSIQVWYQLELVLEHERKEDDQLNPRSLEVVKSSITQIRVK